MIYPKEYKEGELEVEEMKPGPGERGKYNGYGIHSDILL
jgi:hypothetical protein